LTGSHVGALHSNGDGGGGLLGLAVQTPIGAAIDENRAKRGAIVVAPAVLGIGAIIIFVWPTFWPVLIANSQLSATSSVLRSRR
jgi:hypothetical protein